ncbi:MAG: hypothetical protein C4522_08790 [Desulfobacteraceae bacterium]|nr:MAG: hypothetical protein C4522_08790 [Desulfobacteraceae bacterium]
MVRNSFSYGLFDCAFFAERISNKWFGNRVNVRHPRITGGWKRNEEEYREAPTVRYHLVQ